MVRRRPARLRCPRLRPDDARRHCRAFARIRLSPCRTGLRHVHAQFPLPVRRDRPGYAAIATAWYLLKSGTVRRESYTASAALDTVGPASQTQANCPGNRANFPCDPQTRLQRKLPLRFDVHSELTSVPHGQVTVNWRGAMHSGRSVSSYRCRAGCYNGRSMQARRVKSWRGIEAKFRTHFRGKHSTVKQSILTRILPAHREPLPQAESIDGGLPA